jgi:superfamily II DNA helicase RecQ
VTQLPDRFEAEQRKRQSVRPVTSAGADPLDDDPLMAALRAWRTARAREDAVPAYVVFHDQTLAAIAEIRPSSAAGLRRIKGIGPAKLETYGDEILEVVRQAG